MPDKADVLGTMPGVVLLTMLHLHAALLVHAHAHIDSSSTSSGPRVQLQIWKPLLCTVWPVQDKCQHQIFVM